jgi:hypothetical protein
MSTIIIVALVSLAVLSGVFIYLGTVLSENLNVESVVLTQEVALPSSHPSSSPTKFYFPTSHPTSSFPTSHPSAPTFEPTYRPTALPTTANPSKTPTFSPSALPTISLAPSAAPSTAQPSFTTKPTPDNTLRANAAWTHYNIYPKCCPGFPNYDPSYPNTECVHNNGCAHPGQLAAVGFRSYDYVQRFGFFDNFLSSFQFY